jgi:hypothetical protein
MHVRALLFDAYGTLFDVHSVVDAGRAITADPRALSELWRAKQLEYTWLRTLMGRPTVSRSCGSTGAGPRSRSWASAPTWRWTTWTGWRGPSAGDEPCYGEARSGVELTIKTADELVDPALEARLVARRARRQDPVLQAVLRLFLDRGGPIGVDAVAAALPGRPHEAVIATLAELDAEDLILLGDEAVELAYPLATGPNPFAVAFADGRLRYACCAIDALGIPAMVRQPVAIRSRCHHCETWLHFPVDPTGPGLAADGVMVWVGAWGVRTQKVCTSL